MTFSRSSSKPSGSIPTSRASGIAIDMGAQYNWEMATKPFESHGLPESPSLSEKPHDF
jgi:hypothetical protein